MSSISSLNTLMMQQMTQAAGLSNVTDTSLNAVLQQLASPSTTTQGPDTVNVSQQGGLLGKLAQLEQSDPTKFKQVTADIAQKLQTAAGSASGQEATNLNALASKFQQASQSGNLTAFQPAQQTQTTQGATQTHHHHHHHGGGGSAQSTQSSQMQSLWSGIQSEVNNALAGTGTTATTTA